MCLCRAYVAQHGFHVVPKGEHLPLVHIRTVCIQNAFCHPHKTQVLLGFRLSTGIHSSLIQVMQYKQVFPVAGLAQSLQRASGCMMIAATPPTPVVLADPCLFLFFRQLLEVGASIKQVTRIVTIRTVGT